MQGLGAGRKPYRHVKGPACMTRSHAVTFGGTNATLCTLTHTLMYSNAEGWGGGGRCEHLNGDWRVVYNGEGEEGQGALPQGLRCAGPCRRKARDGGWLEGNRRRLAGN